MTEENGPILTLLNLLLEDEKRMLKMEYKLSQNKNIKEKNEMIVY